MEWLSEKPDVIFLGQAVGCAGTSMSNTLRDVPQEKRLELPVFEETQLGMSLGMSLNGFCPVSIFPRWNFLMCAMSQLVNHVDKYPFLSGFKNRVIIRVGIGSVIPLDPSHMHKYDFTEAVKMMCKTVRVKKLEKSEEIFEEYKRAYESDFSSVLVEVSDFFNDSFYRNYKNFNHCQ